eukprot:TRINITY_DN4272_c0_g2_i7.p2 TRINITY_DN4272_c0_g2~~TRINITY_DN4272_c0_g2_i7.p2  ORF type:complete len:115 (+),score=17.69 TRINITY_DN4272_c0_g2_i7:54-398(+)
MSVVVIGSPGSPYTRKVISALRFKRVPFLFILRGSVEDKGFPTPPGPPLLPNVIFDGKDARADSTFILREIEQRYPNRSFYPTSPVLDLLSDLLEDYSDEWLGPPFHRLTNGSG